MWSMGLLNKSEWRAQWISDPNAAVECCVKPHRVDASDGAEVNSYHSQHFRHRIITAVSECAVCAGAPLRGINGGHSDPRSTAARHSDLFSKPMDHIAGALHGEGWPVRSHMRTFQ